MSEYTLTYMVWSPPRQQIMQRVADCKIADCEIAKITMRFGLSDPVAVYLPNN
jgi:hypothetical protein